MEKYTGGSCDFYYQAAQEPGNKQDFICRTTIYRTKDNQGSKEFTVRDETQHMYIFYKGSNEIIVLANVRSANHTIMTKLFVSITVGINFRPFKK